MQRALVDVHDNLSTGMFRGRWNKATPAERTVITAIAQTTDAGVARTARIPAALGLAAKQWSAARQSLIDKGIVEAAGDGRLQFTMPGFGQFALSQPGIDERNTPNLTGYSGIPPASGLPRRPRLPASPDPGSD